MHVQTLAAPAAPTPKNIQVARIMATGESAELAGELARIAYPWDRRDDVSALMALTAARCAAAAVGVRS